MGKVLTHLSLFTGIGGLDLAAEWAGFKTIGQCEWGDYQNKILKKHWPNTPRWKDIHSLNAKSFFDKTGIKTPDVISGGFPCQPFSTAGSRKGKQDERYLWPEFLRIIQELRPNWVVGENVVGIIGMALDDILVQMEKENYETRVFVLPAYAVGALHQRYRVAIVAHSSGNGWEDEIKFRKSENDSQESKIIQKQKERSICIDSRVEQLGFREKRRREWGDPNWLRKSRICRVVDGVPDWMDRLVCLGNAVVPEQFYPIFKCIHDIEND